MRKSKQDLKDNMDMAEFFVDIFVLGLLQQGSENLE